jgi:NAD(P)-dependent dehydrogenase (short-subunit alcohol dehydrogenase family)
MVPGALGSVKSNNYSPNLRLDGRRAIVTGGASGIGQAIARTFAVQGAGVVILDISQENALETVNEIRESGGQAQALSCDVSDLAAVQKTFAKVFNDGRIHILINSAGVAHVGKLEDTAEKDFDSVFRVNTKGVYNCMYSSIRHMKEHGGGVILNIASIAATSGLADRFAYSATKGAVVAMTYSVARDYIGDRIRCNCISPARVHTAFVDGFLKRNYPGRESEVFGVLSRSQPIGRMAQPREVAALALYLCSDEAAFITGADYPFDGGFLNLHG